MIIQIMISHTVNIWYMYEGGWYIWIMISHSVDIWYTGGWYEPQQLAVAVSSLVRNSCFANKYKTNTNTANKYNTNKNTTCLKWNCYSFEKKWKKWWNWRRLCFLCLWQDLKILTLYQPSSMLPCLFDTITKYKYKSYQAHVNTQIQLKIISISILRLLLLLSRTHASPVDEASGNVGE